MFKLGISRYKDLETPCTWFGKRKRASILLLKELFSRSPEDLHKHDLITRSLVTVNGTWKETRNGRFSHLDQTVLEVLSGKYQKGRGLTVVDLAVSSGITSVEFYRVLKPTFTVHYIATDLWHEAIAIRSSGSGRVVVFDNDGHPIQFVVGPFVLHGEGQESLYYPVNRLVQTVCRRLILPRAIEAYRTYDSSAYSDFQTTRINSYEITKLPLLSFEFQKLAKTTKTFQFMRTDIMDPLPIRADIIRAMNILTPNYFDEARLRKGLHNCLSALHSDGVLILGRSPLEKTGEVDATIYVLDKQKIVSVAKVNDGCGLDDLVEEVNQAIQARKNSESKKGLLKATPCLRQ